MRALSSSRKAYGFCVATGLALMAAPAAAAADLPRESVTQFQEQLAEADAIATRCAAAAGTCVESGVPRPAFVDGAPGGSFQADWVWLADLLDEAKTAPDATRRHSMEQVHAHLQELAREAGQDTTPLAAETARARATALRVLARPEFRSVGGPSWWDRQVARAEAWFSRLFEGIDRLGKAAPWLAPLVEWGCFALALAGLLWFVRRSLARQALRLQFAQGAALGSVRGRDAEGWRAEANEHAAAGAWRDAVHCLYWAAIATLEGRRAWKPNPTRTPREYLCLLRTGSEAHEALRGLTRLLERSWYGHDAATEQQFRDAQDAFGTVQRAKAERAGLDGIRTANTIAGVQA